MHNITSNLNDLVNNRYSIHDEHTGEQFPLGGSLKRPYITNGFKGGFGMISAEANDLIAESDLQGMDLKVFHKVSAMVIRSKGKNKVLVNGTEIAKPLRTTKHVISTSLKHLVERQYLIKYKDKVGNMNQYGISPHLLWAGEGSAHRKAMKEHPKPKLRVVKGSQPDTSSSH